MNGEVRCWLVYSLHHTQRLAHSVDCRYHLFFYQNLYYILFICIYRCTRGTVPMWESEDSLAELVPAIHSVGPRD